MHTTIHEFTVSYDPGQFVEGDIDSIWGALHYFEKHLNHDEIATFMHAAKAEGECEFETRPHLETRSGRAQGQFQSAQERAPQGVASATSRMSCRRDG